MTAPTLERLAIVDSGGNVINTILAPATYQDPDGNKVYQNATAEIGWTTTDGVNFVAPPPTAAQLLAYANSKQNTLLGQTWSFNVGTSSSPLVLTTMLDMAGQHSMLQLGMWGQWNTTTLATEPYCNVDFTSATLTATQASLMAIKAGGIVSKTYAALTQASQQITSGKITTYAQIDALAWPDYTVTQQ